MKAAYIFPKIQNIQRKKKAKKKETNWSQGNIIMPHKYFITKQSYSNDKTNFFQFFFSKVFSIKSFRDLQSLISLSLGTGKLGAEQLGSSNHVVKGWFHLGILASLEPAVRVNPQDVGLKHSKHLVNSISNLFS